VTHLDRILAGEDDAREDVARLKAAVPTMALLPDGFVQEIWERFSTDQYCAGFLFLSDPAIAHFREWLTEEEPDRGD
jgi:hypothetical protein